MIYVTPRFTDRTVHGNGFKEGVRYKAVIGRTGLQLDVTVPRPGGGMMERVVGFDGGGGAHLQDGTPAARTAGHFQIEGLHRADVEKKQIKYSGKPIPSWWLERIPV